jgi:hypothetical protein
LSRPPGGKARGIHAIDLLAARRLEGDVDLRYGAIGRRQAQLVGDDQRWRQLDQLDPEHAEDRAIEPPARGEIGTTQLNMIDQSSTMKLHVDSDSMEVIYR